MTYSFQFNSDGAFRMEKETPQGVPIAIGTTEELEWTAGKNAQIDSLRFVLTDLCISPR